MRSLGKQLLRVPELKYMERRAPQDVVGWISIKSNVGQPHLVQSGDATVIRPERRASIEPPEKLLFRGERREHANWSDDGLHPRVPLQELTAEQALEYSLVVHDEADLRASPTTELPAIAKDLYASPIGEPGAEGHVYVLKDPGNGYNINKLLEGKQQHSHLSWEREHMLRDIPPEYIIGRRRVENGRFVGEFEYNPNAVWRIDIGGGRSVPVKEVRGSFPENSRRCIRTPESRTHRQICPGCVR